MAFPAEMRLAVGSQVYARYVVLNVRILRVAPTAEITAGRLFGERGPRSLLVRLRRLVAERTSHSGVVRYGFGPGDLAVAGAAFAGS